MSDDDDRWLTRGTGFAPQRRWSFTTDAPLVACAANLEAAEIVAADELGRIYLLDRAGKIRSVRGGLAARGLAWADERGGAARVGPATLCRLDARLEPRWTLELHEAIVSLAVSPTGSHIAVALANSTVLVFDCEKRPVCEFAVLRPLSHLAFLVEEPGLVGAAEHGLLCRHALDGRELWAETLYSNIGDLAVAADARRILLAAYNHGLQAFDRHGQSRGSYVVDGTATRVACTLAPHRIAATTLERRLYWLDSDGELLWAADVEGEVRDIHCDPLGNWIYVGLASGRILRLDWEQPVG